MNIKANANFASTPNFDSNFLTTKDAAKPNLQSEGKNSKYEEEEEQSFALN